MLRWNFLILESIAFVLAMISIFTCSWETTTLRESEAFHAIYHSPLLTSMIVDHAKIDIDYKNATGYVLELRTGLMEICAFLRQPNRDEFEPGICKRSIARPSIGLSIMAIIFLVIGSACTGLADDADDHHCQTRWLSYFSIIFIGLGALFLLISHWTYRISSELRLPPFCTNYGFSTYFIVTAAVLSLLSMSLISWRLGALESSVKYEFQ